MPTKGGKIAFWTIVGVFTATALTWIGFKVFGSNSVDAAAADAAKKASDNPTPDNIKKADDLKTDATLSHSVAADQLPLQRGSRDVKNTFVKDLQNYLINKYGRAQSLPLYGADGIFGAETDAAVKKYIDPSGMVEQGWYFANIAPSSFDGDSTGGNIGNVNMSQQEFYTDLS